MKDCQFGVSPVNYSDLDSESEMRDKQIKWVDTIITLIILMGGFRAKCHFSAVVPCFQDKLGNDKARTLCSLPDPVLSLGHLGPKPSRPGTPRPKSFLLDASARDTSAHL